MNAYWKNGECLPSDLNPADIAEFVFNQRGWVYIAQVNEYPHLIKIGRSKNPIHRMQTLKTAGVLHSFTLRHAVLFANMVWAEHEMHASFQKHQVQGEFFKLSSEVAYAQLLSLQVSEKSLLQHSDYNGLIRCPTKEIWLQHLAVQASSDPTPR